MRAAARPGAVPQLPVARGDALLQQPQPEVALAQQLGPVDGRHADPVVEHLEHDAVPVAAALGEPDLERRRARVLGDVDQQLARDRDHEPVGLRGERRRDVDAADAPVRRSTDSASSRTASPTGIVAPSGPCMRAISSRSLRTVSATDSSAEPIARSSPASPPRCPTVRRAASAARRRAARRRPCGAALGLQRVAQQAVALGADPDDLVRALLGERHAAHEQPEEDQQRGDPDQHAAAELVVEQHRARGEEGEHGLRRRGRHQRAAHDRRERHPRRRDRRRQVDEVDEVDDERGDDQHQPVGQRPGLGSTASSSSAAARIPMQ